MAEYHNDRRSSGGAKWLWIALALILVLLLAWWLWPGADDVELEPEPVQVEAEEMPQVQEDIAYEQNAEVPIPTIVLDPVGWTDRTVSGQLMVAEVPTDRGFWVEWDGERMLAILVDEPSEAMVDLEPGMTLQVSEATVRDAENLTDLAGAPLDADTEALLADEEVFLLVEESALERYEG